jgi:hypothetical protein
MERSEPANSEGFQASIFFHNLPQQQVQTLTTGSQHWVPVTAHWDIVLIKHVRSDLRHLQKKS